MIKAFEDFENALKESGITGHVTIQLQDEDFERVIKHSDFKYLGFKKFPGSNLIATNISMFTTISRYDNES